MALTYCPIHGDPQTCPTAECENAFDPPGEDHTPEPFREETREG